MPFIYPKLNRFKKYTGKGIQVVGDGISVDGTGLASIQQVGNNKHIRTSLPISTLQSSFEYQVKVKNNQDKYCEVLSTTSPTWPEIQLWFRPSSVLLICYYYNTSNKAVYIDLSYTTVLGSWYYIVVKFNKDTSTYSIDLYDENYTFLATESTVSTTGISNRNSILIIGYEGRDITDGFSSSYLIDLSETFFKNGNGEIISSWNL